MGIFNFFRKKKQNCVLDELRQTDDIGAMAVILAKNNIISAPKDENHNSFGEDLRHLTADGELPFGWVSHRKNIVDQIDAELAVFRKAINEAQTPEQSLAAISDYFQYLEDGKKYYSNIGECEGKYFEEYVIDSEETKGNRREIKYIKQDLAIDKKLLRIIKKSPGILQKDIYAMFDQKIKSRIQEKLRDAEENGVIVREKSGNTYKLFTK